MGTVNNDLKIFTRKYVTNLFYLESLFPLGYCFSFLKLQNKLPQTLRLETPLCCLFPMYESRYRLTVSSAHSQSDLAESVVQDWHFVWGSGLALFQGTFLQHSLPCDWSMRSAVPRGFPYFTSHGLHNKAVRVFKVNRKSLYNLLRQSFIQHNTLRGVTIWSLSPYFIGKKQVSFTCTQGEVMTQRFG